MAQLGQLKVDSASYNADSACVKHDISDIKLMLKNLPSQEKLKRKQEDASYAEIVRNRSSLDNMAIIENNNRQNITELLQKT